MQISDWHQRYCEQAGWTRSARQYLLTMIELEPGASMLEVGCGTGAILSELKSDTIIHGLDINFEYLKCARKVASSAQLTCADAIHLPYPKADFTVTCCHFFLMWVEALAALTEMYRVTQPGGWLLALAEPDYGGRIDYPEELSEIGRLQADSLWQQGAQPEMGRRLAGLFAQIGLKEIRTGVIGAEWTGNQLESEQRNEWQVIRSDLQGKVNEEELVRLEQVEETSRQGGSRVLFVPVFFAAGRKPDD